ncbi:MAG: hypothetical protein ACRDD7_11925 [Peptostreptococcaceae bacterium]
MNNKYVKYESNLKEAQKHIRDTAAKEVGKRIVWILAITGILVAIIGMGLSILF